MELTEAQEAELVADLLALRISIQESLTTSEALSETVHLDQSAMGRVSRVDAMQAQQMAAAGRRRAELTLKQVIVAIQTAKEGDYGICKVCGDDIGYPRLKARPESPACVPCMRTLE